MKVDLSGGEVEFDPTIFGRLREGAWVRLTPPLKTTWGEGGDQTDAPHFWKATGEGRGSDLPSPHASLPAILGLGWS